MALACECVCGREERRRVASSVDVAVLADPVARLATWGDIREEMATSNVIQRDSVLLAGKLSPLIVKAAQEKEKDVSTNLMGYLYRVSQDTGHPKIWLSPRTSGKIQEKS